MVSSVRSETVSDAVAISCVNAAAFGRPDEGRLVSALRAAGDLALSLVAENKGQVVGHVLLSRLRAPENCLALAPLAVLPDNQGQGIGSALIRAAIDQAKCDGWNAIFLLGDPAYYSRFGFSVGQAARFNCAYAGLHFQVLALVSSDLAGLGDNVVYPKAFADLD